MEILLNIIFPPKCLTCGSANTLLCRTCLEECVLLVDHVSVIHMDSGNSLEVFSVFEYEGVVKTCIQASKYRKKEFASLKILSKLASKYVQNLGVTFKEYVVVPIPLHTKKLRERGFNQALIISKTFAKETDLKIENSILIRKKPTLPQFELDIEKRALNMYGAFAAGFGAKNKNILLVDDIYTTGTTVKEAARVLYEKGANKVAAFTLSKAVQ